jgi:hypothetical protein
MHWRDKQARSRTCVGPQAASYSTRAGELRAGVKRLYREPDRPSQSGIQLKNEWRCTSIPPNTSIACRGTILPLLTLMVEAAADSSETLFLIYHRARRHVSGD